MLVQSSGSLLRGCNARPLIVIEPGIDLLTPVTSVEEFSRTPLVFVEWFTFKAINIASRS